MDGDKRIENLINFLKKNNHVVELNYLLKISQESPPWSEARIEIIPGSTPSAATKKYYSGYSYVYNGKALLFQCIDWNTVATKLVGMNGGRFRGGDTFHFPSLQHLLGQVDSDSGIEWKQTSCYDEVEYSGYVNAFIESNACQRSSRSDRDYSIRNSSGESYETNVAYVREDAACILDQLGMSNKLNLFMRLVNKESSYAGQDARSGAGAVGLAQLVDGDEEITRISGLDNFDVEGSGFDNLMISAIYLKRLLSVFGGSDIKAVAAYNWGAKNLKDAMSAHGRNIEPWFRRSRQDWLPEETYNYVRTIMQLE